MRKIFSFLLVSIFLAAGCAQKKSVKFVRQAMPRGSSVGIIVEADNNIRNVILAKFMEKGYKVKAVNASDLYNLSDAFTIDDFKYLAYQNSEIVLGSKDEALTSTQKSYESIYKLHVYNYEAQKADVLNELKNKWGLRYLVVMDLKNWESVSWVRVIELDSYDLIALENYPTKYSDRIDTVTGHFIDSITAQ